MDGENKRELSYYDREKFKKNLAQWVSQGNMHQDTAIGFKKKIEKMEEEKGAKAADEYAKKTRKKKGLFDRMGWRGDKKDKE